MRQIPKLIKTSIELEEEDATIQLPVYHRLQGEQWRPFQMPIYGLRVDE